MRRGLRILLVLVLTGCAVEPPAPSPLRVPHAAVPPPIISRFGDRDGAGGTARPWQHYGIDIRAAIGSAVMAAADGTVVHVGFQVNAGRNLILAHTDDLATVYFHLSEILVRSGQVVRRGDLLARSGMTGNATTPHLHFGVCRHPGGQCGTRLDAGWDDPERYWTEGNPCFDPQRQYAELPLRLTYPLPCWSSS